MDITASSLCIDKVLSLVVYLNETMEVHHAKGQG